MNWNDGETTEEPTDRVWALILWKHGTTSIPLVAQWEPARRVWCHPFNDFKVRHDDVEWCPLPRHERFDDRTHLMAWDHDFQLSAQPGAYYRCTKCNKQDAI